MSDQNKSTSWFVSVVAFIARFILGMFLGLFVALITNRLEKWTAIDGLNDFAYGLVVITAAFFTWRQRKFGLVTGLLLGPFALTIGYLLGFIVYIWLVLRLFVPSLQLGDVFGFILKLIYVFVFK